MIDISFNKVTKSFGSQIVFNDLSFEIKNGKIFLIGANVMGKSTILKMIVKEGQPTSGSIAIRNNTTIGYLSQNICLQNNVMAIDLLCEAFDDIKNMKLKQYENMMQLGS